MKRLFLVALFCVFFAACGSDDATNTGQQIQNSFEGTPTDFTGNYSGSVNIDMNGLESVGYASIKIVQEKDLLTLIDVQITNDRGTAKRKFERLVIRDNKLFPIYYGDNPSKNAVGKIGHAGLEIQNPFSKISMEKFSDKKLKIIFSEGLDTISKSSGYGTLDFRY